ncbi:MAG TPA: maleylpyruvate isomerase N-terminal domain-containing protein [Ktedonobacteraceae bacterium]
MAVNPLDYSGKETVLDVVRTERAKFYASIDNPDNWYVQTRCSEWEVRDLVGHMIDVTEGYLERWDLATKGASAGAVGLQVMSDTLNENAQGFRSLSREEAISRLKADSDRLMGIFEALTPEDWATFMVTHPYMGLYQRSFTRPFRSWTMVSIPGI